MTTNKAFLDHVFFRGVGERWVCSFKGDPAAGSYYRFTGENPPEENNNFFCVSLLKPDEKGEVRRLARNFSGLFVLVVDDVRSKIDPVDVECLLGLPSYKLETSPGNEQWGYVLDPPVEDQKEAEALINALGRNFTSDMAGVNRLARLPVGTNGKHIYGDPSPRTNLKYLDGKRLFDPEELKEALRVEEADYEFSSGEKPFLPSSRDPVLTAFDERGVEWHKTRDEGRYAIRCPWVSQHTGGRDDGSVYLAPAGYKCWHGHCADRTFADLREYLGLSAEVVDEAIAQAEWEAADTLGGTNSVVEGSPPLVDVNEPGVVKSEEEAPSVPLA